MVSSGRELGRSFSSMIYPMGSDCGTLWASSLIRKIPVLFLSWQSLVFPFFPSPGVVTFLLSLGMEICVAWSFPKPTQVINLLGMLKKENIPCMKLSSCGLMLPLLQGNGRAAPSFPGNGISSKMYFHIFPSLPGNPPYSPSSHRDKHGMGLTFSAEITIPLFPSQPLHNFNERISKNNSRPFKSVIKPGDRGSAWSVSFNYLGSYSCML